MGNCELGLGVILTSSIGKASIKCYKCLEAFYWGTLICIRFCVWGWGFSSKWDLFMVWLVVTWRSIHNWYFHRLDRCILFFAYLNLFLHIHAKKIIDWLVFSVNWVVIPPWSERSMLLDVLLSMGRVFPKVKIWSAAVF